MASSDEPSVAVDIPGPEPQWQPAAQQMGRTGNPAFQYFLWDQAIADFREIALLRARFPDVANRLRLMVEESVAAQLGPVEAAIFSISRIGRAISRWQGEPVDVTLWLHRSEQATPDEALDILLAALGIDRTAVVTSIDDEGRWSEPAA